jgi:hypothetical protein
MAQDVSSQGQFRRRYHMLRSEELKDLLLDLYRASAAGDQSFFEGLISNDDTVITIGTEPEEYWQGYSTILRERSSRSSTSGVAGIVPGDIQAFVEGTVGWVADRPTLKLRDASELGLRLTAVFRSEADRWKLVQQHVSIGVPN